MGTVRGAIAVTKCITAKQPVKGLIQVDDIQTAIVYFRKFYSMGFFLKKGHF